MVAFLNARVDEDEEIALACVGINERAGLLRAVPRPLPRWLTSPDSSDIKDEAGILRVRHTWNREGEHIARHDPARTLREVEAKRALLAIHHPKVFHRYHTPETCCAVCVTDHEPYMDDDSPDPWPCATVLTMAAVYSDHPDYDPAWAVEPIRQP